MIRTTCIGRAAVLLAVLVGSARPVAAQPAPEAPEAPEQLPGVEPAAGLTPGPALPLDVVDVTASFGGTEFVSIKPHPEDPAALTVGTSDGHIHWSTDGGRSARRQLVVAYRRYDPLTLRTGNRASLAMRTPVSESLANDNLADRQLPRLVPRPTSRATLLFLSLLEAGERGARHSTWMAIREPDTLIVDAIPSLQGPPAVVAGARNVFYGGAAGAWTRTLGGFGPMPRPSDPVIYTVSANPAAPQVVLAAGDLGVSYSLDGGLTFRRHPNPTVAEMTILAFVWDLAQPDLVFAIAPGELLQSVDGGASFEPIFATDGEIRDLTLGDGAAYVSTSKGLYVATADGVDHFFPRLDVLGAVPWGGAILLATRERLGLVGADRQIRWIRNTTFKDPYLRLVGREGYAWLLSRRSVLRLEAEPGGGAAPGGGPPRMSMSLVQVERAALARAGWEKPTETRLHDRWYAKLLPIVSVEAGGAVLDSHRVIQDGLYPHIDRYVLDTPEDQVNYAVFLSWDLSRVAFGNSNVSNPRMLLESQLRTGRTELLEELRWRYRESESLVAKLAAPAQDPALELARRIRLQEHAAYLAFMTGDEVVANLP